MSKYYCINVKVKSILLYQFLSTFLEIFFGLIENHKSHIFRHFWKGRRHRISNYKLHLMEYCLSCVFSVLCQYLLKNAHVTPKLWAYCSMYSVRSIVTLNIYKYGCFWIDNGYQELQRSRSNSTWQPVENLHLCSSIYIYIPV